VLRNIVCRGPFRTFLAIMHNLQNIFRPYESLYFLKTTFQLVLHLWEIYLMQDQKNIFGWNSLQYYVRFKILTTVTMKISAFCEVMLCSFVEILMFRRTCSYHQVRCIYAYIKPDDGDNRLHGITFQETDTFTVLCLASSCCRSSDVVLRYCQHRWLSTFWGTSALWMR
jgi:hypothetical protein